MGYVNDLHASQFIPPNCFMFSAGTWVPTVTSNVVAQIRTAAAASCSAFIPILIPGNTGPLKSHRLKSIEIWYTVATADLTDFATVEVEALTLPADAVAPTATTLTVTLDTAHLTAALRKVQQSGKITITVTTPVWVADTPTYMVNLLFNCAATSVLTLFGARVNYDYRI